MMQDTVTALFGELKQATFRKVSGLLSEIICQNSKQ